MPFLIPLLAAAGSAIGSGAAAAGSAAAGAGGALASGAGSALGSAGSALGSAGSALGGAAKSALLGNAAGPGSVGMSTAGGESMAIPSLYTAEGAAPATSGLLGAGGSFAPSQGSLMSPTGAFAPPGQSGGGGLLDSLSGSAQKINPIMQLLQGLGGGGKDQGGGMAMPPMQMPSMMPDVAAPQGPPPLSLMRAYQMQM